MPVHDWSRVEAGIFHAFHHDWITEISRALNRGLLPASYYALPEQLAGGFGPDILALRRPGADGPSPTMQPPDGGVAVAVVPPRVRIRMRSEANRYAARANAVVVRHVGNHQLVALVEVVSPGNKNNQNGLNAFVRKAREALAAGVHMVLVDLFPPSARDPQGIHRAVWGEDCGADYALPEDKPLTCVSYVGGPGAEAFIEPVAVGDPVPEMPLFLTPDVYVSVPLEATYQSAWEGMPAYWRDVLTAATGRTETEVMRVQGQTSASRRSCAACTTPSSWRPVGARIQGEGTCRFLAGRGDHARIQAHGQGHAPTR